MDLPPDLSAAYVETASFCAGIFDEVGVPFIAMGMIQPAAGTARVVATPGSTTAEELGVIVGVIRDTAGRSPLQWGAFCYVVHEGSRRKGEGRMIYVVESAASGAARVEVPYVFVKRHPQWAEPATFVQEALLFPPTPAAPPPPAMQAPPSE